MEIETSLGPIRVRRRRNSKSIRIKVGLTGNLEVNCPIFTTKLEIKRVIERNKKELLELKSKVKTKISYQNGDFISRDKKLQIIISPRLKKARFSEQKDSLVVCLAKKEDFSSPEIQKRLKTKIKKYLREESIKYFSPRINKLAKDYNFSFNELKFKHNLTRWGSCTSNGVITLNIALIKLPNELVDQVLIHELCHLRHQNHSSFFWEEVEKYSPNYKNLEKKLKKYSPHI